jgi:hypothetical protein
MPRPWYSVGGSDAVLLEHGKRVPDQVLAQHQDKEAIMRNTARPFAFLISLGWIAFWAGALYLLWLQNSQLRLAFQDFDAVAGITAGGLTRLLAMLVSIAAIIMALPVLVASFLPQRGRVIEREVNRDATPADIEAKRRTVKLDRDVPANYQEELSALRARLSQHDDEIRRLRDHRHDAVPARNDERSRAA